MKREMEALRSSVSELQQHGKVPSMQAHNTQSADTTPLILVMIITQLAYLLNHPAMNHPVMNHPII